MPASSRASSSRGLTLSLLLCAVLASTAPTARAITLPDASVVGTVLFNLGGRQDLSDFGSIGLTDSRFGSVAFTASGTPSPSLVAGASIGPSASIAGLFGRGSGFLQYYFQIVGPSSTVPVRIDVAGAATGLATAGASFAVESRWTLYDSTSLSNVLAEDDLRSGQMTGSFDQNFARTVSLTLSANHTYAVVLLADAAAAATDLGSHATGDASVDPVFSFGPGVDPTLYSFAFSAGIGNSIVPEPGTLALVSAGCLVLGCVRRRPPRAWPDPRR